MRAFIFPAAGFPQYEQESCDGGYGDLPSVDDLEVAAAAAAAAMEDADMAHSLADSDDEDEEVIQVFYSRWKFEHFCSCGYHASILE